MGLQVTALDYFYNLHDKLRNPKLIEIDSFLATEKNAVTDGLTGLYNRHFFDSSMRREIKRADRHGLTFSLVLLDLDNFKQVNDRHGHRVGDEALCACSQIIRDSVREIDVPCRYGGEEFALILPGAERAGAFIVSERIRGEVEERFRTGSVRNGPLNLSLSGGVSIYPIDSSTEEDLFNMADQALYRSKREGKNRITLHPDEKRNFPPLRSQEDPRFPDRRTRKGRGTREPHQELVPKRSLGRKPRTDERRLGARARYSPPRQEPNLQGQSGPYRRGRPGKGQTLRSRNRLPGGKRTGTTRAPGSHPGALPRAKLAGARVCVIMWGETTRSGPPRTAPSDG